jgi:hypothetical protein
MGRIHHGELRLCRADSTAAGTVAGPDADLLTAVVAQSFAVDHSGSALEERKGMAGEDCAARPLSPYIRPGRDDRSAASDGHGRTRAKSEAAVGKTPSLGAMDAAQIVRVLNHPEQQRNVNVVARLLGLLDRA